MFSCQTCGYRSEYNSDSCPVCGAMKSFVDEDIDVLRKISDNRDFLNAMISLKEKDIIEYELKMSQFRNQANAKTQNKVEDNNKVRCPKCGSLSITTGQKGYTFLTGFLGSNKTVNRCGNCGYSWKP